MAEKQVKDTAATKKMSDKELLGLLDALIGKGAQELSLERLMWKPDAFGDTQYPVVGYIVGIFDMPKADRKENPFWKAFVIRTSHPTKGVDREGDIVDVAAGSEVVVPASWELANNLQRFALDPDKMYELGIQAKRKDDIGGGQTMWRFRVIATGNVEPRSEAYNLRTLLAAHAHNAPDAEAKKLSAGAPPGESYDKSGKEAAQAPA